MEKAAEGVAEGKGTLGELINNDVYVRELDSVLTLMDSRLVELEAILRDLKYTTAALPAMAETLGGEIEQMPGLVQRGRGRWRKPNGWSKASRRTSWCGNSSSSRRPRAGFPPSSFPRKRNPRREAFPTIAPNGAV